MRRGGTHWLLAGSAISGVAAYLFQVIGARALGAEGYAPISVLWTIQFLLVSVALFAVESYVAREVALQRHRQHLPSSMVRGIWTSLIVVAVGLAGGTYLYRAELFSGLGVLSAVLGILTISYGAFAVVRGLLAGAERFRAYGLVTATESVIRLALATVVGLTIATPVALAWTMPFCGALAAAWWLVRRNIPEGGVPPPTQEPSRPIRFLVLTSSANAAAQLLLAGGPLLLVVLGAQPAEVSVFFVTVTAARVPVVFALGGVLSRFLPTITRAAQMGQHARIRKAALAVAGATLAVALLGAVFAYLVGPAVIALLFGEGFRPPVLLVSGAAAAVLLATGAMILNQVQIGQKAERSLPLPWWAALSVGLLVVWVVDLDPTSRVALGFVAAEVVALAGLTGLVWRRPAEAERPTPADRR